MLRAILALGGTAAGLAALLSFKTHSVADVSAAPPATSGTTTTTAPASSSATPSMGKSSKSGGTNGGTSTKASKGGNASGSGSGSGSTRMVTGKVSEGPYGPTQIQLVLTGKKITDVNVLQHTDDGTMSQQIDANALPKLTSETLAAQGARIDAVSGATYTSMGYIASLQSAVDSAGL